MGIAADARDHKCALCHEVAKWKSTPIGYYHMWKYSCGLHLNEIVAQQLSGKWTDYALDIRRADTRSIRFTD